MAFDVARVRACYPALGEGHASLDGAAGTQVPRAVLDAVAGAYRAGIGNVGGAFPASRPSDALVAECRRAVADLVGGEPDGVVLGPNMTTLTYRLAATLAAGWGRGDELVVSRLDHDANVRPWLQAAARAGAVVRWAEVDLATGELSAEQYDGLLSERTRLVAVTAASNVLGTRPDVAAIAAKAHGVGALRAGHRAVRRLRRRRRGRRAPGLARPRRVREPAAAAARLDARRRGPRAGAVRRAARRARGARPPDRLWKAGAPHRHGVLLRRPPRAPRRRRAPGRAEGQRVERPQLRLGADRRARHPRRRQRGTGRPGPLQRPFRRGPAARRPGRAGGGPRSEEH